MNGTYALASLRSNKALQQTGLSVAALPLAPAAERRYVGRTTGTKLVGRCRNPVSPVLRGNLMLRTGLAAAFIAAAFVWFLEGPAIARTPGWGAITSLVESISTPSSLPPKEREERAQRVAVLIHDKAGETAPEKVVTALADLMSDGQQTIRLWTAIALGNLGPQAAAAIPALKRAFKEARSAIRAAGFVREFISTMSFSRQWTRSSSKRSETSGRRPTGRCGGRTRRSLRSLSCSLLNAGIVPQTRRRAMASILRNTRCAICSAVLGGAKDLVATSAFISDRSDPLWPVSDAAMHRACFLEWSLREPRFLRGRPL